MPIPQAMSDGMKIPGQRGIAIVQEGSEASEQYRLLQLLLIAHRTRWEYPNANDTTHNGYRT